MEKLQKILLIVFCLSIQLLYPLDSMHTLILNRSGFDLNLTIDGKDHRQSIEVSKPKPHYWICISIPKSKFVRFTWFYSMFLGIHSNEFIVTFLQEDLSTFGQIFLFKKGFLAFIDPENKKSPIYIQIKTPVFEPQEAVKISKAEFIKKVDPKGKMGDMFALTKKEQEIMAEMRRGKYCPSTTKF